MRKRVIVSIVAVFVVGMAMLSSSKKEKQPFHTKQELEKFTRFSSYHSLPPIDSAEYFLTPYNCRGCHGFDTLGQANIDANGMDINLYDDWETSMMGLAGVDPLWRAKVSHEVSVNPGHSAQLQNLCTSCHAPMGHYTSKYKGHPYYTLDSLATDSLGLAGVGCMSCHSIGNDTTLGQLFTGQIPYDTNDVAYGPFILPMQGPMQLYVGLTPLYSDHISESKTCSPCHTLISNAVDLNGNPTGTTFVEQATYHEWLNSVYPAQPTTCQTCHMPELEDAIQIANGYTALPYRSPFNTHGFAGANSFMVNLIKNNKAALGVTASDANFDSTLVSINKLLTEQTLNVSVTNTNITNDTAYFQMTLTNKAGHKFPSGYPARRAFVQFVVTKTNGDTLFATGLFDASGNIRNYTQPYQQHYNVITDTTQVQAYELIMGDVNGDKTTVLERANITLKDNRLLPAGFTTTHYTYDTVKVVGHAFTDSNFNKDAAGVEGTGKDIISFNVATLGYNGTVNVTAAVYYQSVPPSWLTEMAAFNTQPITDFMAMYNAADKTPVLIAKDTLQNLLINTSIQNANVAALIGIYPNPTSKGIIKITTRGITINQLKIYTTKGKLCSTLQTKPGYTINQAVLPKQSGIYLLQIETNKGTVIKKVVRL
ncbi:MAG TPA: T9SS type A sorting domain-containing protein [Bacteroidia bacterium]|nr:T9SS type A sorting domain-containing protein [Bacteroidia bacterium]HNU34632.1 T9SS type A sorting domain-containing protein [Bacteroidia bacterium]